MASILEILNQQLGGDAVKHFSAQLGADETAVNNAISAALPMLVGGLARNAENPQGAQALSSALARDHDGSILDDLIDFLDSGNAGETGKSILGHIFGSRTDAMASVLGRASGLNASSAANLLAMLAPLVMGVLGRMQQQRGLDSAGLSNVLGDERSHLEQAAPASGGLTRILDFDGDGSIIDDLGMIAGILGGFLRRQ